MNKELTQCEWVSTVNGDRCDNHGGHPRICTAVITDLNAELRRQSQELEIMNSRVAVDAKSYERDQYLIAALRKQLASAAAPPRAAGERNK